MNPNSDKQLKVEGEMASDNDNEESSIGIHSLSEISAEHLDTSVNLLEPNFSDDDRSGECNDSSDLLNTNDWQGSRRRTSSSYYMGTNSNSTFFNFRGNVNKLGSDLYQYTSLNYDRCENSVYRKVLRETFNDKRQMLKYNITRWVVTFFIGVLTAAIAFLIDISTESLTKYKLEVIGKSIQSNSENGKIIITIIYFVLFNVGCVCIASLFTLWEPVAAGSGIPEIKTYLNGIKVAHVVRLKTLLAKVIGVVFSVSGGLFVGKEGPMIHSGAVVAAGISQGKSTSIPQIDMFFNMFRTDRAKRDFVSSGAAAGVAAAFGAPIGGVMFALEEGSSFWNQNLTWRSFAAAMVSTFTLNLLLSGWREKWGDLSNPGLVNFGTFNQSCTKLQVDPHCDSLDWSMIDLLFFVPMGMVGGLLGALFNFMNEHITIYRMKNVHKKHKVIRLLEVAVVGAATSLGLFLCAMLLGTCHEKEDLDIDVDKSFFCEKGQWNDMATLAFNSAEESIKMMFHKQDDYDLNTLVYFFILYFLLCCWTYGISVPSGIFVPCLLTGASYGRMTALIVNHVCVTHGYSYRARYASFALIGAASFLGGVVRMTISLTVILIETTSSVLFGLPIMMTLMVAKWVGDIFNEGLYDIHIALKQIPFLEWEPPQEMKIFFAAQVMTEELICIEEIVEVAQIEHLLRSCHHSAFPVVNPSKITEQDDKFKRYGHFQGIILRHQLVILLKKKAYGERVNAHTVDSPILEYEDFINEYPRYPTIDKIFIPSDEKPLYMDLTPYMNPCPYTVLLISPLPRVFTLFRTMGLRHLPVVDPHNNLVGLITRKDLTNLEFQQNTKINKDEVDPVLRKTMSERSRSTSATDLPQYRPDLHIVGNTSRLRSRSRPMYLSEMAENKSNSFKNVQTRIVEKTNDESGEQEINEKTRLLGNNQTK